ncbi:hypothetical protein T11_220 [Trichinella zimbabwensis]|uniref:Uncharacterized protein n=1 Tax=Trichinella zimbabwensis TaxID=268475 RepID=A0A0V1GID7_9BILA|nr:hypothetical protein T11_220 [Trichinella zimbabwensis]
MISKSTSCGYDICCLRQSGLESSCGNSETVRCKAKPTQGDGIVCSSCDEWALTIWLGEH